MLVLSISTSYKIQVKNVFSKNNGKFTKPYFSQLQTSIFFTNQLILFTILAQINYFTTLIFRHQEIVSQSESSDLTDLMLTSLLNTRLAMVIKELTELRVKNDRCTNDLEQSMNKCADLRSQAAEANGRLLRSQQKHASGILIIFLKRKWANRLIWGRFFDV